MPSALIAPSPPGTGSILWLAALLLGMPALIPAAWGAKSVELFRLGFSYSMLADVNENDAKASLRALSAVISSEHGIQANPDPMLFQGTEPIARALLAGEVDAVTITADEYWVLHPQVSFSRFLVGGQETDPREEYLLLVRRDSGLASLSDLTGRRLALHAVPRMRLGYLWLEVQLARDGLPPAAVCFAHAQKSSKLSKVVLDVFFKQADACLVTRNGFAAMSEMNPQVGKQLVVLAASPALVPSFFAFRSGLSDAYVGRIIQEFKDVQRTPAGRQALTIFQVGALRELPGSSMDPAMAMLDEYRRLRPEAANRLVTLLQSNAGNLMGGSEP